jgi:hypothetical protein
MYNSVSGQASSNFSTQQFSSSLGTSQFMTQSETIKREPSRNMNDMNFSSGFNNQMGIGRMNSSASSYFGEPDTPSLDQGIKALKILVLLIQIEITYRKNYISQSRMEKYRISEYLGSLLLT